VCPLRAEVDEDDVIGLEVGDGDGGGVTEEEEEEEEER